MSPHDPEDRIPSPDADLGARCPDCGTELVSEPGIPGLCPQCLLSLALVASPVDSDESEAATLDGPSAGRILGERYQVRELLGRGGMGEVYRAFDLKLRVDVALKAVRTGRLEAQRGVEMLRREVRAAREVVSPNVCRVFDLVEEEGREYVSMEYVDGTTLGDVLRERGPLELRECRELASQFLSGLEAIHQAGLVHRDFKPENVMVTRAGRVVVMDFGLAKGRTEGRTGTVAGTPAYMAPEQSRGEELDARADVFAAGVVLAEMVSVGGAGASKARQTLWRGVREAPPRVPEGPWAAVLRQALDPQPERRHASARALAQALEEVTLRLPGFEEKRPYPGLSSFTEEDAEFFFGREVEVEGVWKKLKRPRLLALIGPSGAGKSSFLQAGLLAALPAGWKAVRTTPGTRPFQALARSLVPFFSGDTEATEALLRFEEPDTAVSLVSRWRRRHEHALVIVDQFEELFTLNPKETQESFARLLGRLMLEADAHVILSLRDDFLIRCHAHEALAPAFSDLVPLASLSEGSLRRALVQPALSCGYRFEDEALVEEMIGAVKSERGALPLLAFAASRLWDLRDRERGLLTWEAYLQVGGVAGALAQHAEATLERLGAPRVPLVREVFRNLVTAQGTRAVREREQLLSVFEPGIRGEAESVLGALLDARLLTSYERAGEGAEGHRQVEIVHESLLQAWPRLVRWQTQDADGAQLRDQLRQAAQAWHDRGRPDDLLWSGKPYRELSVWRESYTGGLSATEEEFARAATRLGGRRRNRRRIAAGGLVAAALAVAAVTTSLWREARGEALRAEASKLLALGQLEIETYPTAALAYALKGLELADTDVGRLFALRASQRGPLATLTPLNDEAAGAANTVDFSPNGEWLALGTFTRAKVLRRDGRPRLSSSATTGTSPEPVRVLFGPGSDTLATLQGGDLRVWSIPDGRELRRGHLDQGISWLTRTDDGFVTWARVGPRDVIRWWPFGEGAPRLVGTIAPLRFHDVARGLFAYPEGRRVYTRRLDDWGAPPRLLGEHSADVQTVALSPDGQHLAASDGGEVRIWSTVAPGQSPRSPLRVLHRQKVTGLLFDSSGDRLAGGTGAEPQLALWDLKAPWGSEPLILQRADTAAFGMAAFDPSGHWLATTHGADVALWALDGSWPHVLAGHDAAVTSLAFTPDGRSLVSGSFDGTVRVWPVDAELDREAHMLQRGRPGLTPVLVDPSSRNVIVQDTTSRSRSILAVPLSGGPSRDLLRCEPQCLAIALGDEGRLVAAAPSSWSAAADRWVIQVRDVEGGALRKIQPPPQLLEGAKWSFAHLAFLDRRRLLASHGDKGLFLFDLEAGTSRILAPQPRGRFALSRDGRFVVGLTTLSVGFIAGDVAQAKELVRVELEGGAQQTLRSHGAQVSAVALDPTDTLVATGSADGTVRIGPVTGEEPHVLMRHKGQVFWVAFSPDGRWLASAGNDKKIILWPVPDLSRPPFHKRPHDEVLAWLRSRTNVRVVPDPGSATGWKLGRDPFPGWAKVPEP